MTITLPDAGERYMTMMVIDEDHYVFTVVYGAGTSHPHQGGDRHALRRRRRSASLVDPNDPKDIKRVHALQDASRSSSRAARANSRCPTGIQASQKKVRDALLVLAGPSPTSARASARKGEVDPVRHLIGTATAWGLNPDKDAIYLNVTPRKNDGKTLYKLNVKDVPVDGFWSISLYNAEGLFRARTSSNAYTLNNITAKKSEDGSVAVQFGGCDGKIPNCLPIMNGWNYMVRLYRPRPEILNGTWKFPEAQPVN